MHIKHLEQYLAYSKKSVYLSYCYVIGAHKRANKQKRGEYEETKIQSGSVIYCTSCAKKKKVSFLTLVLIFLFKNTTSFSLVTLLQLTHIDQVHPRHRFLHFPLCFHFLAIFVRVHILSLVLILSKPFPFFFLFFFFFNFYCYSISCMPFLPIPLSS